MDATKTAKALGWFSIGLGVAGDAMDLALLGTGLKAPASRRRNAWLALGNIAAITALDVYTARQLPA
jgi:hypothetical protein